MADISQIKLPGATSADNIRANKLAYGECSTAAATVAKTVTVMSGTDGTATSSFILEKGSTVLVRFTVTNSGAVANLTLNVNGTGAKNIKYRNANLSSAGVLAANRTYQFVYDGTYWQLIGDLDTNTNTTYSAGTGLSLSSTTFNHSNSVTAGTAKGDDSKTLAFGGTFTVPSVTYDAQGHITNSGTTTMTMPANPNTDTKVTSAANHYTPATDSGSGISVDASSTTAATWNSTSLVTGVNISRDTKGHVTGLTVDSIKMPANPNSNTTYTLSAGTNDGTLKLTPSSGSAQDNIKVTGWDNLKSLATNATHFKGGFAASGDGTIDGGSTTLKSVAETIGDMYVCTTAGTLYGIAFEVGDSIVFKTAVAAGTAPTASNIVTIEATVSVSNSAPTLSWGDTSTIGTVEGTSLTVKMPANPNTDTKVTTVGNHYTPAEDSSVELTANASGATAAWSIDVVKGITIKRDAKGHVTGVSVDSGKIPANPDSNTIPSAYCTTAAATAAKTASCSSYVLTANTYLHVLIANTNTSKTALTLNVNSKGAKPIYINGAASSTSNYTLPAGTYIVYYDGTNYYFRTDGKLTAPDVVNTSNTSINTNTARATATASTTYISSWSAGTVPTLGTAIAADDITSWSAGTLPTLGTAIAADDITSWSAGTLPTLGTAIAADDITSWTAGTAATLTSSTYTFYPVTSGTTTATKVVTKTWTIPNVTAVGTVPTLTSSTYTIPNVTTAANAAVSKGVLTLTNEALGTAFTVKGISSWSAGTTPTLGTAVTVTGVSTNNDVTVPILSASITIKGISAWTANTPGALSYTARSIPNVTAVGTLPSLSYTARSIPNVTAVGTLPSLSYSARSIPNVTAIGTAPTLSYTTVTAVTGVGT